MMRKLISILAAIALMVVSLCGCLPALAESAPIVITDSRGVTIELDKPAERIVCLLNSGLNDLLI